jgi:branched-chain amino acid transport system ATP-binding protein
MPLLEVHNAVVQFGGVIAVNDANFSAEASQITGLIGPNGAGKTTTFNVITGLQPPTKGKVVFNGKDISHSPVDARARMGIGRTFQRLEAFGSLTVRENVLAALDIHAGAASWFRLRENKAISRKADELLERVGVARYAKERADSVPTGTARLLELARALAIEPKMLLLDEPSSGLDDTETDDFGILLRELANDGMAILMVEHDMDLVMSVCDYIHVLEFGHVIAGGTPLEIQKNRRVQEAYLGYAAEDEPVLTLAHGEQS